MLPVKLRLFKLKQPTSFFFNLRRFLYAGRPDLVIETKMSVPLSRVKLSYRIKRGYRKVMAGYLSRMGVPEDEQLAIIAKVFEVVDEAVPRLPITVVIVDVTVSTSQDRSQVRIRGSTWELMETYVDPVINYYPRADFEALKVFEPLKSLECVSLDSLEGATRQTPCLVCKHSLDHFVALQGQGSDEDHPETKIARLPCSHLCHNSCMDLWILCSHLCPLCRHPYVAHTFVEKIIMKAKLWGGKEEDIKARANTINFQNWEGDLILLHGYLNSDL
jgi:hypothetical protein